LQAGANVQTLNALMRELAGRGVSKGYALRLVNRYGLTADAIATGDLGDVFDDTFSEKEISYLRDHEWARSDQAMLQRRTKTNLLASAASLEKIHIAITAALR
jgi:glycerol-3-phosphate dehydrogenase